MICQRTLRRLLDDSVAARRRRFEDVTALARRATEQEHEPDRPELAALVLLRGFDLGEFVAGTSAFVHGLEEDERRDWYHAFTRTVFLVGEHRRLPQRWRGLLRHRSANMAWAFAAGDAEATGLRRLLKPLRTAGLPALAARHRPQGSEDATRALTVAVRGLTLERYLVHLNHALSESLITGALRAEEALELRHVPHIEAMPVKPAYARVIPDPQDSSRLTAAAFLSPRVPGEVVPA